MSPQSVLFLADGVPADLIRPGEPRLRRSSRRAPVAASASVTRLAPVLPLRRLSRLLPS